MSASVLFCVAQHAPFINAQGLSAAHVVYARPGEHGFGFGRGDVQTRR